MNKIIMWLLIAIFVLLAAHILREHFKPPIRGLRPTTLTKIASGDLELLKRWEKVLRDHECKTTLKENDGIYTLEGICP